MKINFEEDIVERYAEKRPILSLEETQDLYRIFKLWLKKKLVASDTYAFDIPYIGIFHKKFDESRILEYERPKESEHKLNEKLLLNAIYKPQTSPPNKKPKYRYEDLERIKNHTNNNS